MNAKKKNKKANKPPNPHPPQDVESEPKKENKVKEVEVEELVTKCEVKEETLSPEIRAENTEILMSDGKESENPKKPKRNKGKNKKPGIEEKIEVREVSKDIPAESVAKIEELSQKKSVEDKKCEENEDPLGEVSAVPSARKKKNKKKMQEKPEEESKTIDDGSTKILSEQTAEPVEKVDSEIQELFSSKSENQKPDGKKKKNKKKNRTDSERSDISDNVLSCTSAFQSILAEDVSKQKQQSDNTVEAEEVSTGIKLEQNPVNTENLMTTAIETKIVEEEKETKLNLEDSKELTKNENKGKKKNKKDKKQQQKEIIDTAKQDFIEEVSLPAEDVLHKSILSDEPKQDMKKSTPTPFDSHKEPSPKPKAKIAKPVEKKKKDNVEAEPSQNLPNIESSHVIIEDKKIEELSKEPELKSEETPIVNITKSAENQIKPQLLDTTKAIDSIYVPSDHTMGKKRKKSPKPHSSKETKMQSNVDLDQVKIKCEVISETTETTDMILDLEPKIQVVADVPKEKSFKLPDAKFEATLKPQSELITELTQTTSKLPERPLTPEIQLDNEGFETKTSKKKKKTLKVPQAEATLKMKEPIAEITKMDYGKKNYDASIPISDEPKQIMEEQASFPLETSLIPDTGVQSVAKESGTTGCDIIPDIYFVRSSSHHLLDRNNNTVIQEVINVEELTLNDPQLMPLILGSGATPTRTQNPISSGIRVTEVEAKSPTEEKTDIKSKMMEVNQDMEELRLSIERSLAEFTSLKKIEKESGTMTEPSFKKEKSPVLSQDHKKESKRIETTTPELKENISAVEEKAQSDKRGPISMDAVIKPVETPPVCPARKDNKGKNKSKKKGKQEIATAATTTAVSESPSSQTKDNATEGKKEESEKKTEQSKSSQEKGKQQSTAANDGIDAATSEDTDDEKHPINSDLIPDTRIIDQSDFEPIEHFEDALTSSMDDVNKTFEIIAKDADNDNIECQKKLAANKPEINITAAEETNTNRNEKVNPVSQPKNLLGHTDIPVQSNRSDYKKEKNKTPNARQARVKIKDSTEIESKKQSKESQTDNKRCKISDKSVKESFSRVKNANEEYVYKYSFRKVFLQSACHVCNRDLGQVRVPCAYCNLVFYCGGKHKDEDWPQHQALCFAVSTLAHMKDQKHIYADAANTTGQEYRLLRMQMIVSCEKVLKRRLVPWEQELMLYPRVCADTACREWRQGKLKDCDGCGQLSFCAAHPEHLPKAHSRWCKSYALYQKLVGYQQTKGRLEPRLPTKVLTEDMGIPGKMNEVLATMYEEKIDMNDIQYASLTQLATAPLTTVHCLQLCRAASATANGFHKKHPFTIHVVGAELQFEADALNKWETFFLHLRPDVDELRVVLVSPQLNPGNLPLDLLGRIKLCEKCQTNNRRVMFKFEDNKNYSEYRSSEDYINPDIICAFNPSIQRSSIYNGKDPWPASINTILKLKAPFIITSYTLNELRKDVARLKQVSELDFKLISEPGFNSFASVRPDRNFISDDEMPLLFKNYCFAVVLGY